MGALLTTQLSSRFDRIGGVPPNAEADDLLNKATRSDLPADVLREMQEALGSSLHETFYLVLLAAVVTFVILLFFPKGSVEDLDARSQPDPTSLEPAAMGSDAAD